MASTKDATQNFGFTIENTMNINQDNHSSLCSQDEKLSMQVQIRKSDNVTMTDKIETFIDKWSKINIKKIYKIK